MRGSRWIGIVVVLAIAPLRAAADTCLLADPAFRRDGCDLRACLACHDGGPSTGISCKHPIDVPYASSWLSGRASLRPTIPHELPLTSGRITCATCHDGASAAPHRLVIVPGSTGLCGACHAK